MNEETPEIICRIDGCKPDGDCAPRFHTRLQIYSREINNELATPALQVSVKFEVLSEKKQATPAARGTHLQRCGCVGRRRCLRIGTVLKWRKETQGEMANTLLSKMRAFTYSRQHGGAGGVGCPSSVPSRLLDPSNSQEENHLNS